MIEDRRARASADNRLGRATEAERMATTQTEEAREVAFAAAGLARFARRSPALFSGGAALAGFAVSWFATATRPEHPEFQEEER